MYYGVIYGVKEDVNEDTDKLAIQLIWDDLEVDVDIDDLGRTHRIGSSRNSNGKTRPIIAKFAKYNARKKVFINKKKLKGKNISIIECLRKLQMEKLQKVRETLVRLNGKTYGGRISIKSDNMIKVFYG